MFKVFDSYSIHSHLLLNKELCDHMCSKTILHILLRTIYFTLHTGFPVASSLHQSGSLPNITCDLFQHCSLVCQSKNLFLLYRVSYYEPSLVIIYLNYLRNDNVVSENIQFVLMTLGLFCKLLKEIASFIKLLLY